MKIWIKAEDIIILMKTGWELGYSTGIRSNGRYWLQKDGLCKGGDTINVHSKTIDKLLKAKLIDYAPKRTDDDFWLTRYGLK